MWILKVKLHFISYAFICLTCYCLASCKKNDTAAATPDSIYFNAYIYPVTGTPIEQGAIVVEEGKIKELGESDVILKKYEDSNTELIDCNGQFLMPGFIEGHGHFLSLGMSLINVNLLNTTSWEEVIDSVKARVKTAKPGQWIVGRGWHQEKWNTPPPRHVQGYPYHDELSAISPDNPVMLGHASGHALFANEAAMRKAGLSTETPDPQGGHILRDARGVALGVFEERAMDVIYNAYLDYQKNLNAEERDKEWHAGVQLAQKECLKYGITTFEDAGSTFDDIRRLKKLAEDDSLDLRLWVMLRHPYDTLKNKMDGLPVIRAGKDMFTCRAIKSETDGALGSYGAWLLEPYADKPGFTGQNTTPIEDVKGIAAIAIQNNMQLCVHSIGDKGNRVTLDIFEETFKANPELKDLRWRVEHAQHLNPDDIPRFKQLGVIASMQGIHCTSDAPFVEKRLGKQRSKEGAYAWRSLLDSGAVIANGTDAPVEDVNPLPCIYASVTRKRLDNGMEFFPEQKMTRAEALYSYTLANAYAAFEEDIKGSLEPGKWADFIILDTNLLTCSDEEIPKAKVVKTVVGGNLMHNKN